MRQPAAALLVALLASCPLTAALAGTAPPAPVEKTFLIPGNEGYGVGECLTGGTSECGQVVANAWCESQGYAAAASYGVAAADEYTGAIEHAPVVKDADKPIRITCKD